MSTKTTKVLNSAPGQEGKRLRQTTPAKQKRNKTKRPERPWWFWLSVDLLLLALLASIAWAVTREGVSAASLTVAAYAYFKIASGALID